jgi:hypothetical protein
MSKMNEVDVTADLQARAVADTLHDALKDNNYLPTNRWDSKEASKREFVDLVSAVLRDEADNYACHDWIGEALHRRLECADMVAKLGHLPLLRDEALKREGIIADMLKKIASLEEALDMAERVATQALITDTTDSNPFPKPTDHHLSHHRLMEDDGEQGPQDTPEMYNNDGDKWLPINPNGYIAYYPDNMGEGTVIMDELTETRAIGGQCARDDSTLESDIESGLAECFELGAQVRPATRIVWSVCNDE